MKKIYFLGLMSAALAVNAQMPQTRTGNEVRQATVKKEVKTDVVVPIVANVTTPSQKALGKAGAVAFNDKVGTTFAINQTNGATYRRVIVYPDGKVSMTWTASIDNGLNGFLSRGSGYNHFNGNTWVNQPTGNRIEPFRAGFPAIANTATDEIIMSHRVDTSGRSGGLVLNRNNAIGGTTWTSNAIFTPPANTTSQLWPRVAVSGNYLIAIANYQDSSANQPNYIVKSGVRAPLVYSRYDLTTNTWVDEDKTLPGYDTTLLQEGGTDNYSIDAKGNTVAIALGGVFNSLVLWKSTDNGATWNRTILDTFPASFVFDRDTLQSRTVNNGHVHVVIDNNDNAHVFSGIARVSDSIMNDGSYTFSWARGIAGVNDGILHWSENLVDSGLRIVATAIGPTINDSALAASPFDAANRYNISNSNWPSAAIDAQGRIFLVYSALVPTDDNGQGANYRDILCTYSSDNGVTWSYPVNLSSWLGFNREEIYPMAARFAGERLHVSYLYKSTIGSQVPNDNTEAFEIYDLNIPVEQILNNKVGLAERTNDLFTISQNYPNPFNKSTIIPVVLNRAADVNVTVVNMVGQTVYSKNFTNNNSGINNFEVEMPSAKPGVYFYTVEAGDFKVTRKMIVE